MIAWIFLVTCVAAGIALLAPVAGIRFRGSTLLGFLLVTLGMTSPLPLSLTGLMLHAGGGGDAFIGIWNLWWTKTALAQGLSPLSTEWLYFPQGTSLALHTYSFTYGIAALPAQWLAGLLVPGAGTAGAAGAGAAAAAGAATATGAGAGTNAVVPLFVANNILLIASFLLSGYFLYRLALTLTGHRGASILAGLLFAYSHYRFANTVRLHVIATEFLVLLLWAWVSWLRHRTAWGLTRAAGAFVLLLYASLEYSAYAVLLLAVPLFGRIGPAPSARAGNDDPAPPSPARRRGPALPVVTLVLLVAAFIIPFAVALRRRLEQGGTSFDPALARFFSADLLDFLLPNPRHPLFGGPFQGLTARWHQGDGGFGLSLGWVAIALLGLSVVAIARARSGRRWLAGFLIFWVLALGPRLHVAGQILEQPPLPQSFLARAVPFLGGSRTPIRYAAPMGICLSLAIAAGWAAWRRRRTGDAAAPTPDARPDRTAGLSRAELALGGLILFESLAAPLPVAQVQVPEAYGMVPPLPGYYSLVSLPAMPARESLLYQTIHRQRLAVGVDTAMPLHSPREAGPFGSPHWETLVQNLATPGWIDGLPAGQQGQFKAALRRVLQDHHVRWIVLHRNRLEIAPDGRGFAPVPLCDESQFGALRDHLRMLHPMHERAAGDAILFEFETSEILD